MPDSRPPSGRGRRGSHARPGLLDQAPQFGRWCARPLAALRSREPDASGVLRQLPHPRTIRAKVVCLLMVPIVALMTLWGLAAVQAAQSVYTLMQLKQVNSAVQTPTGDVISALQRERTAAARFLGTPGARTPGADLTGSYAGTDEAAADLRDGAQTAAGAEAGLGADVDGRISTLFQDLDALPVLRGEIARRQATWAAAQADYTKAVEDALALEYGLAGVLGRASDDSRVGAAAWAAVDLGRSREMLARQTALVAAAQAGGGGLGPDAYRQFAGVCYSQDVLEAAALPELASADAAVYRAVVAGPGYQKLRAARQTLLGSGGGAIGSAEATWTAAAPPALDELGGVIARASSDAVAQADPYGRALATKAGAGVVLGLLAVAVSLVVSVWIGRGLVVELVGLRDAALDLAGRRLPRAIARLRAGESVDLAAERPAGPGGGPGEVGQVAEALASVHEAALRAAVERAEAVSGVAGVFLNLARRSQVLLHRQLALLDLMERRVDDPGDLEDLFRLDHLATRMRRHAEGLIILSGATPGRGWRRPVPLVDVVRAAVAEVEEYARVDVRQMPDVHVAGAAIADLAHLLAELVENATVFSPPHTRVQVQGEQVAAGYVLEIEDRGLGMGAQALEEANRRMDSTRSEDLFDSDRLGLSVVSRLARRHEVRVALRPSAYGGTTAVVLLPAAMLEQAETSALPRRSAPELDQGTESRRARERMALLVGARTSSGPKATVSANAAIGTTAATAASAAAVSVTPTAMSEPELPARPAPRLTAVADAEPAHMRPPHPPHPPQVSDLRTASGLPRRMRQSSLAPGLRVELRSAQPEPDPEEDPASRSPEQARATMAAYRDGWSRGRGGPGRPAV